MPLCLDRSAISIAYCNKAPLQVLMVVIGLPFWRSIPLCLVGTVVLPGWPQQRPT